MAMVYKMAGVRFDIESECTEWFPNQRTVYESEGGVSSTITWIYEPHDGGTKVTVESEYTVQLPVLRKLADSFLTRMNENEAGVILANVKAKMEASAPEGAGRIADVAVSLTDGQREWIAADDREADGRVRRESEEWSASAGGGSQRRLGIRLGTGVAHRLRMIRR
jgi:hypothetical protein